MTAAVGPTRRSSKDWSIRGIGDGVLVLAPITAAVVLAARLGSLGIPHNDAWAYAKITETFVETGGFVFSGWNRPALVGQVVLAAPFERVWGLAGQQLFIALTAVVLLAATYLWVRFVSTPGWARLAVVTTTVFPGLLLLSTSFMTDVPAAAAMVGCLTLGAMALQERSRSSTFVLLALSTLVGFVGVTVRDQSVIAPVVVLTVVVVTWWRRDRSRALAAAALLAALALAVLVFELWRRGLDSSDNPVVEIVLLRTALGRSVASVITLGLIAVPLTAVPGWRVLEGRLGRARAVGALAVVFVVTLLLIRTVGYPKLLPGYIDRYGAYSAAFAGQRETVLPWLDALVAAGAVGLVLAGAVVVGLLGRADTRLNPQVWLALAFSAVYLAAHLAQSVAGQHFYDRYTLPLVAPVAVGCALLAVSQRGEPGPLRASGSKAVAVGIPLALLGVTSMALALNAWAFDAARWSEAERLVAQGWPPHLVDAGIEWVGWHALEPMNPVGGNPADQTWWVELFPSSGSCVLVAASAGDDASTAERRYVRWGLVGPQDPLYLVPSAAAFCTSARP